METNNMIGNIVHFKLKCLIDETALVDGWDDYFLCLSLRKENFEYKILDEKTFLVLDVDDDKKELTFKDIETDELYCKKSEIVHDNFKNDEWFVFTLSEEIYDFKSFMKKCDNHVYKQSLSFNF